MLVEINCNHFIKKKIILNSNLNIVVGDNKATNSIGKSTFLMIIDFIFGGTTYLTHNRDIYDNIGEHEFTYSFKFKNEIFKFKRVVLGDKQKIFKCDDSYNETEEIDLKKYLIFLKEKYEIEELTFREMVGLFMRVWGKKNNSVLNVLKTVPEEAEKTAIVRLIKIFGKYNFISIYEKEQKKIGKKKVALDKAISEKIIHKISETEYKKNVKKIDELENKKLELEKNIFNQNFKISDEYREKITKLKKEERILLEQRNFYHNQLQKLKSRKIGNSILNSFELESIKKYFPKADMENIQVMEMFSKKIEILLKSEIENSKREILLKQEIIESRLVELLPEFEAINKELGDFSYLIVEKVSSLTNEIFELRRKNGHYEEKIEVETLFTKKENEISKLKIEILDKIAAEINYKVFEICQKINEEDKVPELKISENKYHYGVPCDTGTGKGYQNLLLFDLAIFEKTNLPVVIHDSFLFKNLERTAFENFLVEYSSINKQSFISMDEKNLYDNEKRELIKKNTVLELDKDKVLFGKKWNKK